MQCDLGPIGCGHNGIMLIRLYRQGCGLDSIDKSLETGENGRNP